MLKKLIYLQIQISISDVWGEQTCTYLLFLMKQTRFYDINFVDSIN
jgi:hypothetical protein